ncbi:MAG: alkaline phosphatase [Bacteroidales bacterium]|nr:alkaline phosphatase [Bacteroidales bacterium]
MKKIFYNVAFAAAMLLSASCGSNFTQQSQDNDAATTVKAPKYIFYFVGDGMSQPQITMAEKAISEPGFREQFNKQTCGIYNHDGSALNLRKFPCVGLATTNAENRFITCSAAAATALATGHKTTINTISMNGDRTANYESIAEKAKKAGMKVGVVTSVSIDHATPACFYAHVEDRNMYESIAHWLLKSDFDYFGGGFTRWDTYKEMTEKQFMDSLKIKGYTVTTTRKDFDALNAQSGKVLATVNKITTQKIDGSSLPYNIDLDV